MGMLEIYSEAAIKAGVLHFVDDAPKIYVPAISVDTVIFGFHDNKLKVLLLGFGDTGQYLLPGGHVKKEEDLDDAALRILQERTSMKNIYLEQFFTAGKHNRNKDATVTKTLQKLAGDLPANNWLNQRFISVCYYALVDDTKVNPITEPFFSHFKWFDVKKVPKLLYDHNLIIKKALSRLQSDLDEKLVAFNLLNKTFTMNELQTLYEAVYQTPLVRTNFQRKMLSLNVLERLDKQYSGKSHKAPYLYRFIKQKK